MKNVRETQLRKAIVLELDEFKYLIADLFGDNAVVETPLDGIVIYRECDENSDDNCDEDIEYSEICKKLEEYFDVPRVTSYHVDDCEYPLVWIVYMD